MFGCGRKCIETCIRIVTTDLLPLYIGERCSPIKQDVVNQAVDDMLSLGGHFVKPKNGKFNILDNPYEQILMARTYFSNYRLYSYLVSYLESTEPLDSVPVVDSNESCQESLENSVEIVTSASHVSISSENMFLLLKPLLNSTVLPDVIQSACQQLAIMIGQTHLNVV
jgi:hypothetical protein